MRRIVSRPVSLGSREIARTVRRRFLTAFVPSVAPFSLAPAVTWAQAGDIDALSEVGREGLYAQLESEVEEFERQARIVRLAVKLTKPTVVHIETEKIEGRRT